MVKNDSFASLEKHRLLLPVCLVADALGGTISTIY